MGYWGEKPAQRSSKGALWRKRLEAFSKNRGRHRKSKPSRD